MWQAVVVGTGSVRDDVRWKGRSGWVLHPQSTQLEMVQTVAAILGGPSHSVKLVSGIEMFGGTESQRPLVNWGIREGSDLTHLQVCSQELDGVPGRSCEVWSGV